MCIRLLHDCLVMTQTSNKAELFEFAINSNVKINDQQQDATNRSIEIRAVPPNINFLTLPKLL